MLSAKVKTRKMSTFNTSSRSVFCSPDHEMLMASSSAITAASVMKLRHRPEGDHVDVGGRLSRSPLTVLGRRIHACKRWSKPKFDKELAQGAKLSRAFFAVDRPSKL